MREFKAFRTSPVNITVDRRYFLEGFSTGLQSVVNPNDPVLQQGSRLAKTSYGTQPGLFSTADMPGLLAVTLK